MTIDRSERGLSLIEILVALVITGMLAGVLIQAMFVGLRSLDDANERVVSSNDTQLVAAYLTSDVASARAVSSSGTKTHAAPGLTPTVTNAKLVAFWTFKRVTFLTLPDGMSIGWNAPSSQFQIAMADETTPTAGATGNRVAASRDGTSSLSHSVALAPVFLGNVTRRAQLLTNKTPAGGATTVFVDKPAGTVENDTLLAQVAVSGGTTTSVSSPGWTLVSSQDAGTLVKSLVFQKLAVANEPARYTWTFTSGASPVAREAVVGIASYGGVATTDSVNASATDVNPCGGDTPVLLLNWTDQHANSADDVAIQVSYNAVNVGKETHLVRRRCAAPVDQELSGRPSAEQTLATNLAPETASASCVTAAPLPATSTTAAAAVDYCAYPPVAVSLSLTDAGPQGRTYVMRASTRTSAEEE